MSGNHFNAITDVGGSGIVNSGTLHVFGSTLSGNSAQNGGAVLNSGTAYLTGTTISGNYAKFFGSGIASENSGSGSTLPLTR